MLDLPQLWPQTGQSAPGPGWAAVRNARKWLVRLLVSETNPDRDLY